MEGGGGVISAREGGGMGCPETDDDTCKAEVIIEFVTLFAKFFTQ